MSTHARPRRLAASILALGGLLAGLTSALQADAAPKNPKHDWCARQHPVHCPDPEPEPAPEPTATETEPAPAPTETETAPSPDPTETETEPTPEPTATETAPAPEPAPGEVRAFPTAEGFGRDALGGRGGRVIPVTSLADDGPGSLRAALEASGPRIVVFRVGGTIEVTDQIDIDDPFVTVAGQTAPGDGILLTASPAYDKGPLEIATHDVVIRHLRVRAGETTEPSSMRDAVVVDGAARDVILDHVSVSWGTDGNLDIIDGAQDVTVQWSIVSEALNNANHPDGDHSRAVLLTGASTTGISMHHNLFAHNKERNPQLSTPGVVDLVNNLTYNWGVSGIRLRDVNGTNHVNAVANLWKPGPDTGDAFEAEVWEETGAGSLMHLAGNIGPHRAAGDPEWAIVEDGEEYADQLVDRHPAPPVTTSDAETASLEVIARAGATRPQRDVVDVRVLDSVRNGTGRIIDTVDDVGGFPAYESGTPYPDADGDGMDDGWESGHGLDAGDATDGTALAPSGYTWVEVFLNELAGDPA